MPEFAAPFLSNTHSVIFPTDNKCHIIVMYSRGPRHLKVAVMESLQKLQSCHAKSDPETVYGAGKLDSSSSFL